MFQEVLNAKLYSVWEVKSLFPNFWGADDEKPARAYLKFGFWNFQSGICNLKCALPFAIRVFDDLTQIITQKESFPLPPHIVGEDCHLSFSSRQVDDIGRGCHARGVPP